ncbi:MAG TPA: aldehyde dehydrogenase [Streptosporangiaceae bacterium]|jgi:phenylacetaldehyde dehydrogenase
MAATVTDPDLEFLRRPLRLYIDGEFAATDQQLTVLNPATGEPLAQVPLASPQDVDGAVRAARTAFETWRFSPPTQRARLIWQLADLLEARQEEFATIEVLDNGKPLGEARAVDIALTIELLRYYAGWPTKIAGSVQPNSIPGMLSMVRKEPVGVVAAITPWNFPLLEVAYKLGPALAAGCTVVIKPSELAPLSTLRLMDLVHEAGFPAGVVNVVIGGPEVGAALTAHPGVDKIAFTGQTETGKAILRASADDLKRVSLELGGKSPNIVFADADLDAAAGGAFGGIFFNQGQACVAGSRLFAEEPVAEALMDRVAEKARAIRLGHGLDPGTDMGPLISAPHRERVLGYVGDAASAGAEVITGGQAAEVAGLDGGFFVEPTVIGGVRNDMRVAQEEIFGPVLSVISWRDLDELKALANDVRYGLAAGIWTRDTSKALRVAEHIEAGTVWINTYGMFDVAVPFGGRKHSGFGRELGEEALEPYLHSKSVWLDLDAAVPQSGQGISR